MSNDRLTLIPASPGGDDFEDLFWGLLCRKYDQTDLVRIKSTMGGDFGIEGYSCDGVAYQCYADQDSVTLRHRTDKQKHKLYRDTEKLKKNEQELVAALGGMVIRRYVLAVPQYHAAELVTYANERAAVIRSYGLSFISADFAIRIKSPDEYPVEYQAALADGVVRALLPEPTVSAEEVDAFPGEEPVLARNLEEKLDVLQEHHPTADIGSLRVSFTKAFLAKEQLLQKLREWPETWESVEQQRRLRQESIEMDNELSVDQPQLRVPGLVKEYASQLESRVPALSPDDAQRLSFGQTGEWLMRCPLRFRRPL
jgi:hypothetical protein